MLNDYEINKQMSVLSAFIPPVLFRVMLIEKIKS